MNAMQHRGIFACNRGSVVVVNRLLGHHFRFLRTDSVMQGSKHLLFTCPLVDIIE
jgi:hypothetical protein